MDTEPPHPLPTLLQNTPWMGRGVGSAKRTVKNNLPGAFSATTLLWANTQPPFVTNWARRETDRGECSGRGREGQRGRGGSKDSRNLEPESGGGESVRMGGNNNTGEGLASQPRRYQVPGQSLLNWHQGVCVSRSPDGLYARYRGEPTRGQIVRGKGATRAPHTTPHTNISNPPPGCPGPPHPTQGPPHPTQCTPAALLHAPGNSDVNVAE